MPGMSWMPRGIRHEADPSTTRNVERDTPHICVGVRTIPSEETRPKSKDGAENDGKLL